MEFKLLADTPKHLTTLAEWYYKEWGTYTDRSPEKEAENLRTYLNHDKVPLILLVFEEDCPVGAAQLKFHEMSIYPEKTHWLGGVYIAESHRGRGIARQLIEVLLQKAKELNIPTIYLQTEHLDGGLYARMGWKAIEQVHYHDVDVLVMEKCLDEAP